MRGEIEDKNDMQGENASMIISKLQGEKRVAVRNAVTVMANGFEVEMRKATVFTCSLLATKCTEVQPDGKAKVSDNSTGHSSSTLPRQKFWVFFLVRKTSVYTGPATAAGSDAARASSSDW
eukprot:scpid108379/ scgid1381/ 